MKTNGITRKIDKAFQNEEWSKARGLLLDELSRNPKSHWLLTRLSTTYYEQRNYAKALQLSRKAFNLAPSCPLVLWDLAFSLMSTGRIRQALRVFVALLKKGPEEIAKDECGESPDWAFSLVVDCIYASGVCFQKLGKREQAVALFSAFMRFRSWWHRSLYTLEDASARLQELLKGAPEERERAVQEVMREVNAMAV